MIMTEEQLFYAKAHINLCKFPFDVIFSVVKCSVLLSCLASDQYPFVDHHKSIQFHKFCWLLAISLKMHFSRRVYKSCCYPVAVMIVVTYVDNNGIRHTQCEELVQRFEKFVVMTMNSGADLDSLPILDNADKFGVHAYAAFLLELSYVVINNLPQLNFPGSYSTCSISKQRPFISLMLNFLLHYLLAITDRKSCWCWNIVYSRQSTSMQSVSCLSHLLSISVGLLTRIIGAARWPTISLSTVFPFY